MNAKPVQRKVIVPNPEGLHMRPAGAFAQLASKFQSGVVVSFGAKRTDGRSILGVMGLAAEQGSELIIEASGPDQEAAVEALTQFIADLCRFAQQLETS